MRETALIWHPPRWAIWSVVRRGFSPRAAGRVVPLLSQPQRRTPAAPPVEVLRHLASGRVQCGYEGLFEDGRIVEAACWSHASRKYYDIHEQQHKLPGTLAHQALERIGEIFAVEADIRGQPPEARMRERQNRTRPVLDELHRWCNDTLGQISAKSSMAGAISYSLNNWRALIRVVDDGRMGAHNNIAERALRGVAIGRKNCLHQARTVGASAPP